MHGDASTLKLYIAGWHCMTATRNSKTTTLRGYGGAVTSEGLIQTWVHCIGSLTPQVVNYFGIGLHIVARGTSSCNVNQTSLHACTNVDTITGGIVLTMAPIMPSKMSDRAHGGRRGEGSCEFNIPSRPHYCRR